MNVKRKQYSSSSQSGCDNQQKLCLYQHALQASCIRIDAGCFDEGEERVVRVVERRSASSRGEDPGYTMISTLSIAQSHWPQLCYELACEQDMLLYALMAQFHTERALEHCVCFLENYQIPFSLHLELLGCQESYW